MFLGTGPRKSSVGGHGIWRCFPGDAWSVAWNSWTRGPGRQEGGRRREGSASRSVRRRSETQGGCREEQKGTVSHFNRAAPTPLWPQGSRAGAGAGGGGSAGGLGWGPVATWAPTGGVPPDGGDPALPRGLGRPARRPGRVVTPAEGQRVNSPGLRWAATPPTLPLRPGARAPTPKCESHPIFP